MTDAAGEEDEAAAGGGGADAAADDDDDDDDVEARTGVAFYSGEAPLAIFRFACEARPRDVAFRARFLEVRAIG